MGPCKDCSGLKADIRHLQGEVGVLFKFKDSVEKMLRAVFVSTVLLLVAVLGNLLVLVYPYLVHHLK
jgi:hypothetical protein